MCFFFFFAQAPDKRWIYKSSLKYKAQDFEEENPLFWSPMWKAQHYEAGSINPFLAHRAPLIFIFYFYEIHELQLINVREGPN